MEKINFTNGKAPALNGTNLNQLQTNIENAITEIEGKVDEIVRGTLISENGVTVDYSSYIVYGNILILVASLTATKSVGQYYPIATFSNGNKGLVANGYINDNSNKTCYVSKASGTINIYKSGGLTAGEQVVFVGTFALNT